MIDQNTKLTLREAYTAMYKYLEHEYEITRSDEIGAMLGSMSFLEDGGTADPVAWNDWLQSVEKVLNRETDINLQITNI